MNSLDYKKHMEANNLIESIESVEHLANAIRLNDNIKRVSNMDIKQIRYYDSYGLQPKELIPQMLADKTSHIKLAIKYAYDKEWALKQFGRMYEVQIKDLQQNIEPTIAALGYDDIKQQMGAE